MSKRVIVKVQVPLASNSDVWEAMIYNEDRSLMQILPMRSEEEKQQLMETLDGEPKGYFYAELDGKGGLILVDVAPWQDW